ncbi:hypothetical protein KKF61_08010 [Patescibacteria group bacterium]|nr:hypothetical protein [Patescibacteria group bacterium]
MIDEAQNVEQEVVHPDNVTEEAVDPQEQQPQEAQTETAEKDVTQEEKSTQGVGFGDPRHPDHERFIELRAKQAEAEAKAAFYQQQLEASRQPQKVEDNPYAGMDAETEKFYRHLDERAQRIARQENSVLKQQIEIGKKEIALLRTEQFFKDFPDIKQGSQEEREVAALVSRGYPPKDARKIVLFDRIDKQAAVKAKTQVQQKTQQKRQANVEQSSGVSAGALPKPNETFEQTFNKFWDLDQQGKL